MFINKVQLAAYELIQSDARFIYSLVQLRKTGKRIETNYIMMAQPYIALFADGAEQWCNKMNIDSPRFSGIEKEYYSAVRQNIKLFDLSYNEFRKLLLKQLLISEQYFRKHRSPLEEIIGYNNTGVDLCEGKFCGNTILGAIYSPFDILNNTETGIWIRSLSIIAGKLAEYFQCKSFPQYNRIGQLRIKTKDYHFFEKNPLRKNNELGFVLFSVLCTINYIIEFWDKIIIDEIPQKFKFAYIQYYYLCDFICGMNRETGLNLIIDKSLYNRNVRNCFVHYGLGMFLNESDIIDDDLLKGITQKAFGYDYKTSKEMLYSILRSLTNQIESLILK